MSKHDFAAAVFKTTFPTDNTRCTEFPVPKAAAKYAGSYMKTKGQKGTDLRVLRAVLDDTFFKIRRKFGHDAQFMGGVLNRGDVLW